MTAFEMAYLNNEILIQMASTFSILFGTFSAFLVASFMAAHRLTRTMAAIAVALFLLSSLMMVSNFYSQSTSLLGLTREMKTFAKAGKGLAWHPAVTIPDGALVMTNQFFAMMLLAAIAASVHFFFHCRRVNRKPEPIAEAPKA
jgi:hypothetical protein